jgi:hypothetical protein
MEERGGGGLTDVGEDLCDGLGLGKERDEREGRLAGGTDQRKHFIDPGQKGGPPGGPGGSGVRCPRLSALWLGSRGGGGYRGRKRETGSLSGEGIVLLGPFGDEGSQGRIGGKDTVVSVAVDAGWGEDRGQAIQELQGGETESGAAGRVWLRQDIEDLVGTAADEMETVESEGRSGTIPKQPFQSLPVASLDTHAGVQAEPTTVIPCEHTLSVVGFQEAVTTKVT